MNTIKLIITIICFISLLFFSSICMLYITTIKMWTMMQIIGISFAGLGVVLSVIFLLLVIRVINK